jgi:hypothetical protein
MCWVVWSSLKDFMDLFIDSDDCFVWKQGFDFFQASRLYFYF